MRVLGFIVGVLPFFFIFFFQSVVWKGIEKKTKETKPKAA